MNSIVIRRAVTAPISDQVVRRIISHGLAVLQLVDISVEVGIQFIGPVRMRSLNRERRGIDAPTDVISLPLLTPAEIKKFKNSGFGKQNNSGPMLIGDIVICPTVARQRAREEKVSLTNKYAWLLVHGLLHLAGYDHEVSVGAARTMEVLEQQILSPARK